MFSKLLYLYINYNKYFYATFRINNLCGNLFLIIYIYIYINYIIYNSTRF